MANHGLLSFRVQPPTRTGGRRRQLPGIDTRPVRIGLCGAGMEAHSALARRAVCNHQGSGSGLSAGPGMYGRPQRFLPQGRVMVLDYTLCRCIHVASDTWLMWGFDGTVRRRVPVCLGVTKPPGLAGGTSPNKSKIVRSGCQEHVAATQPHHIRQGPLFQERYIRDKAVHMPGSSE